jgi:apolipoprotein D and lipocalin family protein
MNYSKTVKHVDIPRFMGTWYVWAGRTSFLERGAHNAVEKYTWNDQHKRIDIDFIFNKNTFNGKIKKLPQKAWIYNKKTNAHWKVQPLWPLKFDYLVIALDQDYQWTAIGVPSGSYLWIMGREPLVSERKLAEIIRELDDVAYPTNDIVRVPQKI